MGPTKTLAKSAQWTSKEWPQFGGVLALTPGNIIRTILSGQAIRGARFYPAREQFEDVSSGVWTYLAVYAADVPWVSQAQFPDDVALALAAAKITATGGLDGDAPITVGG